MQVAANISLFTDSLFTDQRAQLMQLHFARNCRLYRKFL